MTRPYSVDLREPMVRAVEAGASRRATAAKFEVSPSCMVKLVQRWRRTGSLVAIRPTAARRLAGHGERSRTAGGDADITITSWRAVWRPMASRSARPRSAVAQACGLTRKKRPRMPPSRTGRPSLRRGAPGARSSRREPRAPGVHRRDLGHDQLARRHGRARRGQRLLAAVPTATERRAPSSPRCAMIGSTAPCVFEGAINGARFRA